MEHVHLARFVIPVLLLPVWKCQILSLNKECAWLIIRMTSGYSDIVVIYTNFKTFSVAGGWIMLGKRSFMICTVH
jgi:hypothetical protein